MVAGKRIGLLSMDASYGNCVGLHQGLSHFGEVVAMFHKPDKKGMHKEIPTTYPLERIPQDLDVYVVMGCVTAAFLNRKRRRIPKDRAVLVVNDGYFLREYQECTSLISQYSNVHCMPDKIHYMRRTFDIFYPPFESVSYPEKAEQLTIAHSPWNNKKQAGKGTRQIIEAVGEMDVEFDLICDVPWRESIKRKSRAHLFIDQLVQNGNYIGGLGKSGIEAMAAGCLTFTSGRNYEGGVIPCPPVVRVNSVEELREKLEYYIDHEEERVQLAEVQRQWVAEYLSYKDAAKRLLNE